MRLKIITFQILLLLGGVGLLAPLVCGDETDAFIKEIIQDARTDSQRAAKLMEAVPLAEDNKKLQIALLEKTIEYGKKSLRSSEDCARVLTAAGILAKKAPERESYWISQKAAVYRRMATLAKSASDKERCGVMAVDLLIKAGHIAAKKGDWKASFAAYGEARSAAISYKQPVKTNLSTRLRAISTLVKAREQVEKYAAALAKTPEDATVRANLVKTLLVTLDDPAAAAKYVNEDIDQAYQTYVPLAGKKISAVEFEGSKSLGEWYHKELSKTVISLNKYRMLIRARNYYRRAQSLYGKSDITSAAMKHQTSQIEAEIAKLRLADPLACVYCMSAEKTSCPACVSKGKSTGKLQCAKCKNTGRMKCAKCNGIFGIKCKACGGQGYAYVTIKTYYGKRRSKRSCSTCSGTGNMHYDARYKRYRYSTCSYCRYHKPRGSAECTTCSGGGGTAACSKCDGGKTLRCTRCPSD